MAYTVLARRYRSVSFDQLVGQEHIAQTLQRAISSGRIAHAFLFCGSRGTGKTSVARILAKALNCLSTDAPTTTPCNRCASCEGISRGADMDYVEIDAASNTQVEKTREAIINNVGYRPALCRFKIFLIDEVHMLSKSSFNALLKTLEEPPPHVKFILATTEPEKIPNTIVSRCQRFDFKSIAPRKVAAHLRWICQQEGIEADDDALLKVARAGGGSMRDALSILERLLSVGETKLTLAAVGQLLGEPPSDQLEALVSAMGEGDAAAVLTRADEILSGGMSVDALIAGLVEFLHQLLLLRVCGTRSELLQLTAEEAERLGDLAGRFDEVVLTQDLAVLEELRRQVRSGAAGRPLVDATLVRLALAEQFRGVSELLSQGASLPAGGSRGAEAGSEEKKKPVSPPAVVAAPAVALSAERVPGPVDPPPAPTPPAGSLSDDDEDDDLPRPGKVWDNSGPSLVELLKSHGATTAASEPATTAASEPAASAPVGSAEPVANIVPVDERTLPEVWRGVLEAFHRSQPSLAGILTGSVLGSVTDGYAVVRLPPGKGVLAGMIEQDGRREKVSAALSTALGRPVGVRVEVPEADEAAERAGVGGAAVRRVAAAVEVDVPAGAAAAAAGGADPGGQVLKLTDELRAELLADDLVRSLVEDLGATIVKVVSE